MDVNPQLLHDVEFREAKRGGYNTQDVDEFLERLAVGIERQDAQLREARQRLESAEARITEAERRASETSDADDTLKRTLVLAQRTADAAIRDAEERAAKMVSEAEAESSRLLTEAHEATAKARAEADLEARRAQGDARERALAELRELEVARDQLRRDVELLEGHVTDQRDRLRHTADELQRLLDDPAALQAVAAPQVSDAAAPSFAPYDDAPSHPADLDAPPEPAVVDDEPSSWTPDDEVWSEDDDAAVASAPAGDPGEPNEGPPTQPVDMLAERDADDDAYLAELRKAMTDDTPLGPRDDYGDEQLFERGVESGRSRFGRRR